MTGGLARCSIGLGLGLFACAAPGRFAFERDPREAPTSSPAPAVTVSQQAHALTPTELVNAARPAVVLILNYRPDGKLSYGAGLLVSRTGLVLTSHHVVADAKSLRAMLYRKDRVTYTPMDGGLQRFVFEYQDEVYNAELVDMDATSDLAVLRIGADTAGITLPEFSTEPLAVGDKILVIGHPQEAVWSFTAGSINALPNGAIQHDAVVSHGSSGGPVFNEAGKVVGISVAKVISEPRGFAFARPISMASAWLEASIAERELDLSSPKNAAESCWHAQELASQRLPECFDWGSRWDTYLGAVRAFAATLGDRTAAQAIAKKLAQPGEREAWIAAGKERALMSERKKRAEMADAGGEQAIVAKLGSLGGERLRLRAEVDAERFRVRDGWKKDNGLEEDLFDSKVLVTVLRMGIRVEAVREIGADKAWVLLAGRNRDGKPYRFTECWAKVQDKWLQHSPPTLEDRAALPEGWPPPIEDRQLMTKAMVLKLLNEMAKDAGLGEKTRSIVEAPSDQKASGVAL